MSHNLLLYPWFYCCCCCCCLVRSCWCLLYSSLHLHFGLALYVSLSLSLSLYVFVCVCVFVLGLLVEFCSTDAPSQSVEYWLIASSILTPASRRHTTSQRWWRLHSIPVPSQNRTTSSGCADVQSAVFRASQLLQGPREHTECMGLPYIYNQRCRPSSERSWGKPRFSSLRQNLACIFVRFAPLLTAIMQKIVGLQNTIELL